MNCLSIGFTRLVHEWLCHSNDCVMLGTFSGSGVGGQFGPGGPHGPYGPAPGGGQGGGHFQPFSHLTPDKSSHNLQALDKGLSTYVLIQRSISWC